MSKFKDYYQLFLNNILKREEYKIIFNDESELIGVPSCGSMINPKDDPEFSITFEDEDGNKQTIKKPFSSIKNVEKVIE